MNSLYLDHFGLISPPFSITPDPGFFFEGKDRGLFMSGLLHATLNAEGIVIVIGEVGSGKTLMSRMLLARLPEYVDTVYLPNPAFSRDEIIDVIARDLGLTDTASSKGGRLESLQQELIRRHSQNRRVVVLVDEAHTMPPDSLEEIRRLSNLETDNHKLVQIILFGQPELNTLLEAPQLRQVNDRVVYRLTLRSLSHDDARAYLDHRLRVAGWRGGRMFSWLAERMLLADATGRARRINLIADKSLLAAYADQSHLVKANHVRLAIRDVGRNFTARNFALSINGRVLALWLVSIATTVAFTVWLTGSRTIPDSDSTASSQGLALAATNKPPLSRKRASSPNRQIASALPDFAEAPARRNSPQTVQAAAISVAPDNNIVAANNASLPASFAEHLRLDYNYAQQQAATDSYAIQLATIQTSDAAINFLSLADRALTQGRVFARRSPFGKQSDYQQSRYVIYLGSYASYAAASHALAQLPDDYRQAQPIIRTLKDIIDAPWIH
ncbi:MAG: AAA family ATPase [Sideroxydans sp.]|nr:AAA family ATPase [Sideroxydans sp.]